MKQFYTLGAMALLTASAFAATPLTPFTGGMARDGIANGSYQLRNEAVMARANASAEAPSMHLVAASGMSRAASDIEITLPEIVLDRPDGEMTNFSRDCVGYWSYSTGIYNETDKGAIVHMVKAAGNEVWLDNPVALLPMNSWIKGTLSDDGNTITIKGAQAVYHEELNGEMTMMYLVPVEFVKEHEDGTGWYYPTADATYTYQSDGKGGWKPTDLNLVQGLCRINEEGEMAWIGYGNLDQILTPHTETVTELPEGLNPEKWVVRYDTGGHMADVARGNGKIYIRGLFQEAPEGWAVGEISGQTVSFEVGQYLGEGTDMHYAYLYGGDIRPVYNEHYGQYFNEVYATLILEFDYNAADKALTNCIAVTRTAVREKRNVDPDTYKVQTYLPHPTVKYIVRDPECPPSDPYGISFFAYDDQTGYGFVDFRYANEDTNGYILPTEDLYYRVFFNEKLHTFYPDEYASLEKPMVLVPYNYSDFYDFDNNGYLHTFYYYSDSLDRIGIQNVYLPEGAETGLVSLLVSFPVTPDAIDTIDVTGKTVSSELWFDLQGRIVENPAAGLYIVRTVYTDGTVITSKVIKK